MTRKSLLLLLGSIFLVLVLTVFSGMAVYAAEKPIELRWSWSNPPDLTTKFFTKPLIKKMDEVTGGRVKTTLYVGGALGSAREHVGMVKKGVVDIGMSLQAYTRGLFPCTSVMDLPYFGLRSAEEATRVEWALYKKFPEFQKEYAWGKILGFYAYPPQSIYSTKKHIRTLEDWKGLKVRAQGDVQTKFIKLVGATAIPMPVGELYGALQKGVVDAFFFDTGCVPIFGFQEISKYATQLPLWVGSFWAMMNWDSWNALPADIQQKLDKIFGESASLMGAIGWDSEGATSRKTCNKAGVKFYTLPNEEWMRWKKVTAPIYDAWVTQMEAKGLPGRALLDEVFKITKSLK